MVPEVLEPLGMVLDGLDPLNFFFNVFDPLGNFSICLIHWGNVLIIYV